MPAPERIVQLVEKFAADAAQFRNAAYNETQTRIDFVNPLFAALGWDIDNREGLAENLREVVHEDKVKVGPTMKAPDYSFRIGGQRKFFVETKKPGVFLKVHREPAYQLRRYAWTAKLPISILTDFEEFAVYDGRVPPEQKDPASRARIDYFTYKDYEEKWDEIVARFSRAAVAGGSLDKMAVAGRKGVPVDAKFLEAISGWREKLAGHLAENNSSLTPRALNFAVQMLLDRIIFLRICEDRGVETEFRLSPLLNGVNTYARLLEIFHHADDRYNSGLFHFKKEAGRDAPDSITGGLHVSDRPIKEILAGLYYPESPFEFSVFPADILGQVYEQFLGQVIRVEGKTAVVEDKPEVKKAGGVFYTPTYIVDNIVEQSIGRLLEGKTPKQVAAISILDPACGSGSFLIGAYQFLLDWHLSWYIANEPEKEAKRKSAGVFQNGRDEQGRPRWRLTTAEKKRILLNNIYGVDIDTQAVEVTKLSLLLKVLEGESAETVNANLKLFKERALPDLEANIKCGNSLIGLDFYDDSRHANVTREDQLRINAFSWNDAYPKILQDGGFDAIIGNPPWISLSGKFGAGILSRLEIDYLIDRFRGNTYMPNMYEFFVAQGISLCKDGSFFSFIVPDRLGFNQQFLSLRQRILSETKMISLTYKLPFPGVTVDTLVFVLKKSSSLDDSSVSVSEYGQSPLVKLQSDFTSTSFGYFENEDTGALISAINAAYGTVALGLVCQSTSGFGGKSALIRSYKGSNVEIPVIKGDSTGWYEIRQPYWFYFAKENITGRTTDRNKLGKIPKILLRKTGNKIVATYDETGIYPEQSLYFLFDNSTEMSYKYLLGLLNSKMMNVYYRAVSLTNKNSIAQIKKFDLDQLPIRNIDFSNVSERTSHDKLVALANRMLILQTQQADAATA